MTSRKKLRRLGDWGVVFRAQRRRYYRAWDFLYRVVSMTPSSISWRAQNRKRFRLCSTKALGILLGDPPRSKWTFYTWAIRLTAVFLILHVMSKEVSCVVDVCLSPPGSGLKLFVRESAARTPLLRVVLEWHQWQRLQPPELPQSWGSWLAGLWLWVQQHYTSLTVQQMTLLLFGVYNYWRLWPELTLGCVPLWEYSAI